jgi:hypothetical protein
VLHTLNLPSVPLYVFVSPIVERQLGKNVTASRMRMRGRVVFYAIRVLSKESRRLFLPRISS